LSFGEEISQKYEGSFHGTLILQTFATHLTAVKGMQKIADLDDKDTIGYVTIRGLTLSVAPVSVVITTLYCILTSNLGQV
jgi:hypothetical protein